MRNGARALTEVHSTTDASAGYQPLVGTVVRARQAAISRAVSCAPPRLPRARERECAHDAIPPPNESRLPAVLRRPPPRKCQVLLMSRQNLGRGRFSGPVIYSSAGRSLLRCCSDRSDPFPLRAFCVCALLRSAARLAKRAPGRHLGSSACVRRLLPWSALK